MSDATKFYTLRPPQGAAKMKRESCWLHTCLRSAPVCRSITAACLHATNMDPTISAAMFCMHGQHSHCNSHTRQLQQTAATEQQNRDHVLRVCEAALSNILTTGMLTDAASIAAGTSSHVGILGSAQTRHTLCPGIKRVAPVLAPKAPLLTLLTNPGISKAIQTLLHLC